MDYPKQGNNLLLDGRFTDGDPINSVPASLDPASWSNQVTDELLNVIRAAGIEPSELESDQLLQALGVLTSQGGTKRYWYDDLVNDEDDSINNPPILPAELRIGSRRYKSLVNDSGVIVVNHYLSAEQDNVVRVFGAVDSTAPGNIKLELACLFIDLVPGFDLSVMDTSNPAHGYRATFDNIALTYLSNKLNIIESNSLVIPAAVVAAANPNGLLGHIKIKRSAASSNDHADNFNVLMVEVSS